MTVDIPEYIWPPGKPWPPGTDPGPEPESPPGGDSGGEGGAGAGTDDGADTEGRDGSRWNALRGGLRSRVLFADMMIPFIEKFYEELAAALKPRGSFEEFLILEMARASAQLHLAARQEVPDQVRFLDLLKNNWAEYRREAVARHAARLPRAPEAAARALRRTRQGAEYCLENLRGLKGVLAARGALDENQRTYLFDLIGVPQPLRDDPERCPAGNDAVNLGRVISGEITTLERSLECSLIARDQADQQDALAGLPVPADAPTRLLKANMSRARRRIEWARGVLEWLRSGGSLAGLIDPETKKPVAEAAAAHAARGGSWRVPRGARGAETAEPTDTAAAEAPRATAAEAGAAGASTTQDEELSPFDREALALGGVLLAESRTRHAAPADQEAAASSGSAPVSAAAGVTADQAAGPGETTDDASIAEAIQRGKRPSATQQKYRERHQRRKRRRR